MLRSFLLIALWLTSAYANYSFAQEFKEYPNGLIYDETTMKALHFIVDSMNLKYRKCDPWKDYYSLAQGSCHAVSLDSFNVKKAMQDIMANIGFDNFCKKYPRAKVQKNLLAIKEKSKDYRGTVHVEFSTMEMGDAFSRTIDCNDTNLFDKKLNGKWVYEYFPKTEYSRESITALYFVTEFNRTKIPDKYARMIQYSDCMIDTNSAIFTPNAAKSYHRWEMDDDSKEPDSLPIRTRLNAYINEHTAKPDRKHYKIDSVYEHAYYSWLDTKDSIIEATLVNKVDFDLLLKGAIAEAIKIGISDEELELLALKHDTKGHALQLKRERIVVGGCSQDSRPRVHAQQIAILAAETASWDIFLRAHLDIMNDRFSRMSDGSYAYARRNTYIKELEKLDFDVATLMMGITLRIENPSGNHYFGSIARIGRALSETENPIQIEEEMVNAIQDSQLDVFNRVLIYYLYHNYIYFLSDSGRKAANISKLRRTVSNLPKEYRNHIVIRDSDYEKKER